MVKGTIAPGASGAVIDAEVFSNSISFLPVKIITALHNIMSKVSYVKKTGKNDFHGYKYTTEADFLEKIRPLMIAEGLILIPEITEVVPVDDWGNTFIKMQYTLAHVSGEVWPRPLSFAGAGGDKNKTGVGDKGLYKAITGSNKYFLSKLFQIETGDDPENETAKADEDTPPSEEDLKVMDTYRDVILEIIKNPKWETAKELGDWWKKEAKSRAEAKVVSGTEHYTVISDAVAKLGKSMKEKEKKNG